MGKGGVGVKGKSGRKAKVDEHGNRINPKRLRSPHRGGGSDGSKKKGVQGRAVPRTEASHKASREGARLAAAAAEKAAPPEAVDLDEPHKPRSVHPKVRAQIERVQNSIKVMCRLSQLICRHAMSRHAHHHRSWSHRHHENWPHCHHENWPHRHHENWPHRHHESWPHCHHLQHLLVAHVSHHCWCA